MRSIIRDSRFMRFRSFHRPSLNFSNKNVLRGKKKLPPYNESTPKATWLTVDLGLIFRTPAPKFYVMIVTMDHAYHINFTAFSLYWKFYVIKIIWSFSPLNEPTLGRPNQSTNPLITCPRVIEYTNGRVATALDLLRGFHWNSDSALKMLSFKRRVLIFFGGEVHGMEGFV